MMWIGLLMTTKNHQRAREIEFNMLKKLVDLRLYVGMNFPASLLACCLTLGVEPAHANSAMVKVKSLFTFSSKSRRIAFPISNEKGFQSIALIKCAFCLHGIANEGSDHDTTTPGTIASYLTSVASSCSEKVLFSKKQENRNSMASKYHWGLSEYLSVIYHHRLVAEACLSKSMQRCTNSSSPGEFLGVPL